MALVRRVAGKAVVGKAVRNRPRDGGYKATRAQDGRMTGRAIERRLSPARATCPTRPETLRGGDDCLPHHDGFSHMHRCPYPPRDTSSSRCSSPSKHHDGPSTYPAAGRLHWVPCAACPRGRSRELRIRSARADTCQIINSTRAMQHSDRPRHHHPRRHHHHRLHCRLRRLRQVHRHRRRHRRCRVAPYGRVCYQGIPSTGSWARSLMTTTYVR